MTVPTQHFTPDPVLSSHDRRQIILLVLLGIPLFIGSVSLFYGFELWHTSHAIPPFAYQKTADAEFNDKVYQLTRIANAVGMAFMSLGAVTVLAILSIAGIEYSRIRSN